MVGRVSPLNRLKTESIEQIKTGLTSKMANVENKPQNKVKVSFHFRPKTWYEC